MPRTILSVTAIVILLSTFALAVPPDANKDPVKANIDAEKARAAVGVPAGMTVELWAAEPLMANPVAFCFDEKGRAYVAETTRVNNGVPDTRGHMYWLDEDIGSRSVADRLKMYAKHKYGAKDDGFTKYDDQVRLVWDADGNGHATKSTVFSKGYNQLKDGLMSGVLARKGSVYVTNIPDLYRLQDKDGDGVAEVKDSLATGFGVRTQFVGHDLHGLRMGPDGKLYFSIGDRGLNVTTVDGRKLSNPDSGAVLRFDPDGKNMEIVHVGLRNPQELAFDDFGNLFTYDNNSDSGDRARWVQIVEGGDSGWRCGYQYGTLLHTPGVPQGNRGPWNTEKIWHVPGPDGGPPAYVVPPLKHFGNGPSGVTHYPGVGLNEKYKDHFFAADFTANPGGSKIWAVSVKPKGASFEVTEKEFVTNMVPTDCEFGPDGAFYFSDWVGGWGPPGKGRIFRITDPEALKNPAVAEAKKLLAEGFEKKSVDELAKLLEHPHQQVRLEAQYELMARPLKDTMAKLYDVANNSNNLLARIHSLWALGPSVPLPFKFTHLLSDKHAEIRFQAARTLGRLASVPNGALEPLTKLLADTDPRVQSAAAVAYGKIAPQHTSHWPGSERAACAPLFDLLKSNADKDVYVRQAAVQGLVSMTKNPCDLLTAWQGVKKDYDTPAVRMGVVLALRRMECRKLGEFLGDADPRIVVEAARAIHDQNLMEPMAELAKLTEKAGVEDAVQFRALSANFKLGEKEHAERIARFAARSGEKDFLRAAALKLLADWPKPSKRDHITGLRQDLAERSPLVAVEALKPVLAKVFVGSGVVRKEAAECAKKLGLSDAGPLLLSTVTDGKQPVNLRVDSLFALADLKAGELATALKVSADATEPKLRGAVRVINARRDPTAAEKELPAVLKDEKAAIVEKQMALEAMGRLFASRDVDASLAEWCDSYLAGKVPDELKLDVIEATKARAEKDGLKLYAPLREKLKAIDTAARAAEAKDHLSRNREALAGGDAERGRDIFLNSAAVYCQRCHKLDGQGGEVGPPMNGVAKDKTREYLLEAITHPSKQIAKGYEAVQLTLLDGRTVSGVLKSKTKAEYVIATAEAKIVTVPAKDVDFEKPDKSAMPDDLVKKMSKRELRDVVEFLAGLKEQAPK
jgi:quinoprotein glucose dehydrogenase